MNEFASLSARISLKANRLCFITALKRQVMQSSPSVCQSVRLFPLYLWNRLTVDLELLHVMMLIGHDHSSQEIEGQGYRSRSMSWVRLMRSV